MSTSIVMADPGVRVERVIGYDDQQVIVEVTARSKSAACPRCGAASMRVHSVYLRIVRDVPWQGRPVLIHAWVRRFFCDVGGCPRTIFCERLPWVLAGQRRTVTFTEQLSELGWATNAETAAKTANRLGLPSSPDTVLRCLRRAPEPAHAPATIIGIDDWALRKGSVYGTVVVDLQTHQVLDVFKGRDAEALSSWLRCHPGVRIVSRDRASAYARGVREAAPDAKQVADRFHILKNLGDALHDWLKGHPAPKPAPASDVGGKGQAAAEVNAAISPISPGDERRALRWKEIVTLRDQGQSTSAIARTLGTSRGTVRAYLRQGVAPRRPRQVQRHLVSWQPVLEELYAQGAHTGVALWTAARVQGYPGAKSTLYEWLHHHHPEAVARTRDGDKPSTAQLELLAREWAQACMTRWLLLPRHWTAALSERLSADPAFRTVWSLVHRFHALIHFRRAAALDAWQRQARASGVGFLVRFADGLDRDREAVLAGCTLPWSQGVVEGKNTRSKFLKRLMYGRANFDLLRLRILHVS